MEKRIFEFRADDLTFDINGQLNGVIGPGVYAGFDAQLDSGLTLKLVHTQSGATFVDGNPAMVEDVGVLRTKQGTIIREDETIEVVISENTYTGGHPEYHNRIDTIVCEHYHQEIIGGSQAQYYAIPGGQASDPVPPALTDPTKQTIVGYLFLPGGCASMDDTGVVFTKVPLPYNPSLPERAYPATYDSVWKKITSAYKNRAFYYLAPGTVTGDYLEVGVIDLFTEPGLVATIISDQQFFISSGSGIRFSGSAVTMTVEAFEEIIVFHAGTTFGDPAGTHLILNTGKVYKDQVSKLYKMLINNIGTGGTFASHIFTFTANGNIQKITLTGAQSVKGIKSFAQANTRTGYNSGATFIIQITADDAVIIEHMASGVTSPNKPIYVYGAKNISLTGNSSLFLYEDTTCFYLFQYSVDMHTPDPLIESTE